MFKKIVAILLLFVAMGAHAQDIPSRPEPARLVNDFAGVLSKVEKQKLEQELDQFARETSNQVVVVTVPSLDGYDASSYAFQLGQKWGVGQKNKDNGVIILFQPKTSSHRGNVFIAVGYGLEGVIPDAVAHRTIVSNEMIPRFKKGDVYGGLKAGAEVIMGLAKGEFSASDYQKKVAKSSHGFGGVFIFILIIGFVLIRILGGRRRYYTGGGSLPFWLLMGGMMGAGSNRGGSWDDFSGGSGGFGGGDFGGFGGGGFGGGGAGGSW